MSWQNCRRNCSQLFAVPSISKSSKIFCCMPRKMSINWHAEEYNIIYYQSYSHLSVSTLKQLSLQSNSIYHAVSSMKIPSRSSCMNSSPPHKYSSIKYNFSPVWKAYIKSTMKGCWKYIKNTHNTSVKFAVSKWIQATFYLYQWNSSKYIHFYWLTHLLQLKMLAAFDFWIIKHLITGY